MTFNELLEWQWRDYSDKHRNVINLFIHIFFVPLFWIEALEFLGALLFQGVFFGFGGILLMALSLFLQGMGHELESSEPHPFTNRVNFLQRILVEQFITFPRFVISGGWWGNLKKAG